MDPRTTRIRLERDLKEMQYAIALNTNIYVDSGGTVLYLALWKHIWTPLKRREGMVRLLLERGASVHVKSKNGATALHRTVSEGCEGAVLLLMRAGAAINAADYE
jgi:26S proteasome non-ATPase regulatory subunit 10